MDSENKSNCSNKRRPPKDIFNFDRIYLLLNRLGITANYAGFHHVAYAVYLTYHQPDSLLLVTKRLYPDIARQYNTKWNRVERNIRTVITIAWEENRPLLEELAGHPLPRRPQPVQFLSILTAALYPETFERFPQLW